MQNWDGLLERAGCTRLDDLPPFEIDVAALASCAASAPFKADPFCKNVLAKFSADFVAFKASSSCFNFSSSASFC